MTTERQAFENLRTIVKQLEPIANSETVRAQASVFKALLITILDIDKRVAAIEDIVSRTELAKRLDQEMPR